LDSACEDVASIRSLANEDTLWPTSILADIETLNQDSEANDDENQKSVKEKVLRIGNHIILMCSANENSSIDNLWSQVSGMVGIPEKSLKKMFKHFNKHL
jgi:hypothetical protein